MSKKNDFPELRSQAEIDEERLAYEYANPWVRDFMSHPIRNFVMVAVATVTGLFLGYVVTELIFPWLGGWE